MKFPMVLVDAKPTAAPPRAEKAKNHSVGNPPTLTTEAVAPVKSKSRNVRTKLFATFGARCARLANLLRYLVITLSRITAMRAITTIERMVDNLTPKKVCDSSQSKKS